MREMHELRVTTDSVKIETFSGTVRLEKTINTLAVNAELVPFSVATNFPCNHLFVYRQNLGPRDVAFVRVVTSLYRV